MHRGIKRKLLAPTVALKLVTLRRLGVPYSRLIKDLDLSMTVPTLTKLITAYDTFYNNAEMTAELGDRLFPSWLNLDCDKVQEAPEGWVYQGYFPLVGEWVHL